MASRVENRREQALRWVNEMRAKYGGHEPLEELPGGYIKVASNCPLSNGVKDCFGKNLVTIYGELVATYEDQFVIEKTPKEVFGFVKDFDQGKHPDLVKGTVNDLY